MHPRRSADRERAVAVRERARALNDDARDLRVQSEHLSDLLAASLRAHEGVPFGERGDRFSLGIARMPAMLGVMRQELLRWLERSGVADDDAAEIALACSEACANAIEHPQGEGRRALEIEARIGDDEVEVAVDDFGSWRAERTKTSRGRGLAMMRSLMDEVTIREGPHGTRVQMRRRIAPQV